jgi:hypothetical protein
MYSSTKFLAASTCDGRPLRLKPSETPTVPPATRETEAPDSAMIFLMVAPALPITDGILLPTLKVFTVDHNYK